MIVRKSGDLFVLIRQHDHALVSGQLAERLKPEWKLPENVVRGISLHDCGWEELDEEILWNERTGAPHSFEDYPLAPKVRAYTHGIDRVEEKDPYAAFLCSMHYSRFFENGEDPVSVEFFNREQQRRMRLAERISPALLEKADDHYGWLLFFDRLSLAICMNEPGENRHPWFRDGIRHHGVTHRWVWENEYRLRLDPELFSGPFSVSVPYRLVNANRQPAGAGTYRFEIMA
ncbi:DUF3891 family protein [Staphylospora marina]|uniref:DUF3891 family protein n=1 Tax=Staphylospora marina TaxID=2490858 RepID=UPI000F5C07AA|nr:DUF3891 family protein [Staphylospora marina]